MKITATQLIGCFLLLLFSAGLAITADEKKDLATGEGAILLQTVESQQGENQYFHFEPRYGYAYSKTKNSKRQSWLLMTDQDPVTIDWKAATDRTESLRLWCESKKAAFVLVELDAEGTPQLVTQCPADGSLQVEMISVFNGLPSVEIKYEINDAKRLRGHLTGGSGSCGEMTYCEKNKDYYFDVTFSD